MTRPCASCGLVHCDGIECYLADPADYPPEEVASPRPKYVPSPEYLAWIEEIDGGPDPLIHLEPKRSAA